MKLYALKCDDGYLKRDQEKGCIIVSIEKASVFDENNPGAIEPLLKEIRGKGWGQIKLVELSIVEKEDFTGGVKLKSRLQEALINLN